MKVLMFGWEFPPHISGGLGTACFGLSKGLLQNDVGLVFVVPKAFGDEEPGKMRLISADRVPVVHGTMSKEFLSEKFTYYGLNSYLAPYLNVEQFQRHLVETSHNVLREVHSSSVANIAFTGKYGTDLLNEVWNYALVAAEVARNNPHNIIHAHDWLSFPAGIVAKEISGKPLIAHVHATEIDRSGENVNQEVFEIEKKGMQAADKIIAVSEFTRQIIIENYGIDPAKIEVVHNAVEFNEKARPGIWAKHRFNEKIVTYLGRVTYQKGPEYFVDAAAKVLQKDRGFRFVMAGSGDMLHRMIKKAAALRISSHFHFTGFLKGAEVDRVLGMSSVYVMPSVSEPFGISPLEAVRSDVPVIISKQSGVSEVLKHAMKVDFWDSDAMANAIFALARFKGLAKMYVRESKKEMNELKWITQAAIVKNIYNNLINDES